MPRFAPKVAGAASSKSKAAPKDETLQSMVASNSQAMQKKERRRQEAERKRHEIEKRRQQERTVVVSASGVQSGSGSKAASNKKSATNSNSGHATSTAGKSSRRPADGRTATGSGQGSATDGDGTTTKGTGDDELSSDDDDSNEDGDGVHTTLSKSKAMRSGKHAFHVEGRPFATAQERLDRDRELRRDVLRRDEYSTAGLKALPESVEEKMQGKALKKNPAYAKQLASMFVQPHDPYLPHFLPMPAAMGVKPASSSSTTSKGKGKEKDKSKDSSSTAPSATTATKRFKGAGARSRGEGNGGEEADVDVDELDEDDANSKAKAQDADDGMDEGQPPIDVEAIPQRGEDGLQTSLAMVDTLIGGDGLVGKGKEVKAAMMAEATYHCTTAPEPADVFCKDTKSDHFLLLQLPRMMPIAQRSVEHDAATAAQRELAHLSNSGRGSIGPDEAGMRPRRRSMLDSPVDLAEPLPMIVVDPQKGTDLDAILGKPSHTKVDHTGKRTASARSAGHASAGGARASAAGTPRGGARARSNSRSGNQSAASTSTSGASGVGELISQVEDVILDPVQNAAVIGDAIQTIDKEVMPQNKHQNYLNECGESKIGKLRVYESGRVVLVVSGVEFDIEGVPDMHFYEHLALLTPPERGEFYALGPVDHRFTAVPNVDKLLGEGHF